MTQAPQPQKEKMQKDPAEFEKKIDAAFRDKDLLREAFTHRSYLNENRAWRLPHNERLEFLGDAVLELAVTEYLFEKYPNASEGDLTAYRSALVNANTLSSVASDLGMNDFLLLSRGEAKDTGRARQFLLANAFEALVGAIYLDQGMSAAKKVIAETVFPLTEGIVAKKLWLDAKSAFQEKAQEHESITPTYETLKEEGPDHDKTFVVGVSIGNDLVAQGLGRSKQEAEQEAAREALKKKGW